MAKVKVTVGYNYYIMDESAAFALFKGVNGATVERLDSSYSSELKVTVYKVTPMESGFLSMSAVSDQDYAMWKLAGASV